MKNVITNEQIKEFRDEITATFKANSLPQFLSDYYIDKFFTMSKLMTEFNLHTNLTAITDISGVVRKHLADSLLGAEYFPTGAKVIDIGTGGGFPSLPLAIARDDLNILAVDSTAKKLKFVDIAAHSLGLHNITAKVGRAEDIIVEDHMRSGFDCVCARAVAPLEVLTELCVPFLKIGGKFIAYKGADGESERAQAQNAARILGCDTGTAYEKTLSDAGMVAETRNIIVFTKISETPQKYPRIYSQIKGSPL